MLVMNIGHYEMLLARRSALVARMSDSAKHLAFPKLYRRPLGYTPPPVLLGKPRPKAVSRPAPPPPAPKVSIPPRLRVQMYATQIDEVIRVCAEHFGVTAEDIIGHNRRSQYTLPRFACMKLIRVTLPLSVPAIGHVLARRDHTTILAGLKRADKLHKTNCEWHAKYEAALAQLSAGNSLTVSPVPLTGARQSISPASRTDAR